MLRACLLIAGLLMPAAAAAAEPEFNIDFRAGWGGCFRPLEWTPLHVSIHKHKFKKPMAGTLSVSLQQDDQTRVTVGHPIVLTPDQPLYVPLASKIAAGAYECEVRILDENGRSVWSRSETLQGYYGSGTLLTALNAEDMLIGLVGARKAGLMRLSGDTVCRLGEYHGEVRLGQKQARYLPWDWTGYCSLDLLILYNPDWSLVRNEQIQALGQWVRKGGKLLVVLGGRALPADHAIRKLIPFRIGEVKEIGLGDAALNRWGSDLGGTDRVPCRQLTLTDPRLQEIRTDANGQAVFGTALVGFGQVGVVPLDPDDLKIGKPAKQVGFWVTAIAALTGDAAGNMQWQRTIGLTKPDDDWTIGESYVTPVPIGAANSVMGYLYTIRELRPISIWWVILILAGLALALGPLDYLVLKRLDRLPWTWVTSAVLVAVFTAVAYYGVENLRGGRMQARVTSVIDGIQGQDTDWCTTHVGLFSPRNADYQLAGLQPRQWWSSVSPTSAYGHSYGEQASRHIRCQQLDGANLPVSLPISIWTMQLLQCESPRPEFPIAATVRVDGDEVHVRLVNRLDHPILSVQVYVGTDRKADLGPVGPSGTNALTGQLHSASQWVGSRTDSSYLNSGYDDYGYPEERMTRRRSLDTDAAYLAGGTVGRTCGMGEYLQRGAALICVRYNDLPAPFQIADRACDYNHVQLVRLVVFPTEGADDD